MPQNEGFKPTDHFSIREETLTAPSAVMHYHNSYELYYVVKGERDYFIEDHFFKADNNNIVLVPKGLPHRTAGKGATRILLFFTDEFLYRHFSPTIIKGLLEAFKTTVLDPSEEENDILTDLFKKMSHEYAKIEKPKELESFDNTLIPMYVFELLYRIRYGAFTTRDQSIPDKRINEIVKHINENFSSIESISDVSEHFFISKYHLCRTWKKNLGISLVSYINMIKIREACKMLETTDMSITEIATRCGFNSSAYFCKVFREETKISPREYKLINGNKA